MYLTELYILDYRNLSEVNITLAPKINCFVGLNGMGKTNVLDSLYLLSFTKSSLTNKDSLNIRHGKEMAMVRGTYLPDAVAPSMQQNEALTITCGIANGRKKQFRRGQKEYKRLTDHIGLLPLVMVSPQDQQLIAEGSDERRRFLDSVISQYDRVYLEHITSYQQLLKQRNTLLKQCADRQPLESEMAVFDILEEQLTIHAIYIHQLRQQFVSEFVDYFRQLYLLISGDHEQTSLRYVSQLDERDMLEALRQTRQRDIILGWTTQGVHKDELEMTLDGYPLRQVGSQGQQKTFLLALKLAQAQFLANKVETSLHGVSDQRSKVEKPILLLDDIFDKLDSERVERIIKLVGGDNFGQILITDTDRQHISELLRTCSADSKLFEVSEGKVIDNA